MCVSVCATARMWGVREQVAEVSSQVTGFGSRCLLSPLPGWIWIQLIKFVLPREPSFQPLDSLKLLLLQKHFLHNKFWSCLSRVPTPPREHPHSLPSTYPSLCSLCVLEINGKKSKKDNLHKKPTKMKINRAKDQQDKNNPKRSKNVHKNTLVPLLLSNCFWAAGLALEYGWYTQRYSIAENDFCLAGV